MAFQGYEALCAIRKMPRGMHPPFGSHGVFLEYLELNGPIDALNLRKSLHVLQTVHGQID